MPQGEGAGGGRSGQSRQHKNTRKKRHSHLSLTPPAVHTACRAVCLSVARSNKHGAAPPDLRAASTRPPHARREKGLVSPMRAQAPSAPQARRPSDRHVHLDLAVRLVPDELQVGKGALLDGRHRVGDAQLREQERLAGELLAQRGDVVVVHVRVANHVHEVAALEPRHVREQAGEQRIRGDVEWDSEAEVGGALVHLARELAVGHVELRKHVARGERHLGQVLWVPRRHDDAPVVRLLLERADHLRDLVDSLAGVVGVHVGVLGAKVAPLPAVHGPEVANLPLGQADRVEVVARRVAVPNLDALVLQRFSARVARQEPNQLLGDAAPEDGLCREEGEAVAQREAHLRTKLAARADAGPVRTRHAGFDHLAHQVEVLQLLVRRRRWRALARLEGEEAVRETVLIARRRRARLAPRVGRQRREVRVAPERVVAAADAAGGGGLCGGADGGGGGRGGAVGVPERRVFGDLGVVDALTELGEVDRFGVDGRAADHKDRLDRCRVVALAELLECVAERGGEEDLVAHAVELACGGVGGDDDVEPVAQRPHLLGDRLPRLAPHDDGILLGRVARRARELLEVLHVAAQPPRQLVADANPAALLAGRHNDREAAATLLRWLAHDHVLPRS
mmetsp:Transcript_17432/g.52932  ORF Transcript_17432/g.52932 Transcript_17432/m.52932 type:complete len:624 (-) Transcript_17432:50-1921(-)